ncbi:MAG: hypothetical protein KF709_07075 [Gemmatimonadaceae bacterium]|nr:hypothetical protein [Gemmatimonadaceae bacterium]
MATDAEQRSPLRERVPASATLAAGAASPESTTPLRAELARKAIHLGTAALPVGWAFGWIDTATLRMLLSAALAVAICVELARFRLPRLEAAFTRAVGGLLRGREQRELTGATWLAAAMCLVVWAVPMRSALVALWAAAVGDASGALVGRSVQAWRGRGAGKSLTGTLAVGVATAAGALWLAGLTPAIAAVLGAVAAVAERPRRPLDDNLRVALAVALAAMLVGVG